ncbi:MAG TPA: glycosyltransferase family 2 protein [Pyrinomonadaceae bacterium]|nr:glycosyltransferase family 2 protein [Pyrinomonadaceae bacterium]
MKFSVIIATYNRAEELPRTLESLKSLETDEQWEVIVVDNNSSDNTREVVENVKSFPVPLHYVMERVQGRSAALNAGIRLAQGEILAITDDDVRVDPRWLVNSERALRELNCDYVGGKALPIWSGGKRPDWLPNRGGKHWGVIALLDYGPEPIEFGDRVPLGVNMVFRRHCFERAGLWDNSIGRKAGTLLGQEVREWAQRARAAGLRGFYSPDLIVHHVIPEDRLTKRYFRRWFYWHGISRAILYQNNRLDMESPESTALDFSTVPHVAGVPRYLYRTCLKKFVSMWSALARRDAIARFEDELWIWFFAGIVSQRWKDRQKV